MTMDEQKDTQQQPRRRSLVRAYDQLGRWRLGRPLLAAIGMLVIAVVAVGAALEVTPMQTVTVAGQVITVGSALRPSLSGPGQVDLFGQSLATAVSFPGPVRPRLALTQITLNSELADFVKGGTPRQAAAALRDALVSGWERYFGWEAAAAGLAALILAGALAGWRRLPAHRNLKSTRSNNRSHHIEPKLNVVITTNWANMKITSLFRRLSVSPLLIPTALYAVPLRLIVGLGFAEHGYA